MEKLNIMLNQILIVVLCLTFSSCYSQNDNNPIDNWKIYSIPTDKDTLRNYNYSSNEWAVSVKNAKVYVNKRRPYDDRSMLPFKISPGSKEKYEMMGKCSIISVSDGYLLGFERGEWGGHLYWFSKDGQIHYKISDDEIIQFIAKQGKNYAIQGLDHLGISEGSIINIEQENGKWIVKDFLKLAQAPYTITTDADNDFIVLTSESLLRIYNNRKIDTLVKTGLWSEGLYPNSMVIKDNIVYVGMRAGIFKYNLLSGKQEWLLPY